jgi:hypothetical protein
MKSFLTLPPPFAPLSTCTQPPPSPPRYTVHCNLGQYTQHQTNAISSLSYFSQLSVSCIMMVYMTTEMSSSNPVLLGISWCRNTFFCYSQMVVFTISHACDTLCMYRTTVRTSLQKIFRLLPSSTCCLCSAFLLWKSIRDALVVRAVTLSGKFFTNNLPSSDFRTFSLACADALHSCTAFSGKPFVVRCSCMWHKFIDKLRLKIDWSTCAPC